MRYGILGADGSTNGLSYETREDAQKVLDENIRSYPKMWSGKYMIVEFWVLQSVMFCKECFPTKVAKWRRYEFD